MMKEKIDACYKRLQTLDIAPTRANMEALLQTLYDLRDIYEELEREGVTDAGRTAVETE
jgi:hypothetical protein